MLPDFGDHAPFVWAAYGLTVASLLGMVLVTAWRLKRAQGRLQASRRDRTRR